MPLTTSPAALSDLSPARVAPFTLSDDVVPQLAALGRMSAELLLMQLEARAYVVLFVETGRAGDQRWSQRLGLNREYSAQYRHVLLWSEPDQAHRIVVYSIAYCRVVLALSSSSAAFGMYVPRLTPERLALAVEQSQAHDKGLAPPPFEVLISWLTPDGRPCRRIYKLAKLVGADGACNANAHRDRLAMVAVQVAVGGVDIHVTIRSQRQPALIASEFQVDNGTVASQVRWANETAANQ